MKQIVKIELQFENCEYVTIPSQYFGYFSLHGIHEEVNRYAGNYIGLAKHVDEVAMEIFSEVNLGGEVHPIFEGDYTSIFDRLTKWSDITHICTVFADGTEDCYCVDYKEEGDWLGANNINQSYTQTQLGNLYIVISKNKTVSDIFDSEEINDEKLINLKKQFLYIDDNEGK